MKKYLLLLSVLGTLFVSCSDNTPLSFKGIYLGCPEENIEQILSQDETVSYFRQTDYDWDDIIQDYLFNTYIIGTNNECIKGLSTIKIRDKKVYYISFYCNLKHATNKAIDYLPNIFELYEEKYGKFKKEGTSYIKEWENQSLTISWRNRDLSWRESVAAAGIDPNAQSISVQEQMDGPNDITIVYKTIFPEDIEAIKKTEEKKRMEKEKIQKEKDDIKRLKQNQDI